ncbi:MAG: MltA domain-containing protein [Pseudomonadota bacterium]
MAEAAANPADRPSATLPGWDAGAIAQARAALGHLEEAPAIPSDTAAFDTLFAVQPVGAPDPTHVTAYYEPVLQARRARSDAFPVPILGKPSATAPLPDRAAIMNGALEGMAPALYWLADPVDLYFLQIQGSGRLRLDDGSLVRLGYGGANGHPYVSIGRIMREEGVLGRGGGGMRGWLRADRARGMAMMARNPSYIFFAENRALRPEDGPVGAMGLPLPAGAAIAVDPEHHAYGGLFWLAFDEPDGTAVRRIVMAMDTGAAIKGAARVDWFVGTGDAAGHRARRINTEGRLYRLLPRSAP